MSKICSNNKGTEKRKKGTCDQKGTVKQLVVVVRVHLTGEKVRCPYIYAFSVIHWEDVKIHYINNEKG